MGYLDAFSGLGGQAMMWMTTTAFWIFIMVAIVIFGIMFLLIRKSRKMNKLVLECFDLGDGHFDYRLSKGGWFKSKFTLFGLWDYGAEDRFRMKDMTPVDNVSQHDYCRINGKAGVVVVRNPHDQAIAFPISKSYLSSKSKAIMNEVAPADFRDTARKAVESVDAEMQSKWAQYAPYIVTGVVIVIALIITLLNTQYGKYMMDKSLETMALIKTTPCQVIPSPNITGGAP